MTLSATRIDELLARARGGDAVAADSLIGGLRGRIVRWALIVTRDRDDAEDVAQQVSLTLHRKLGGFEARASFTTWLYTIVRNASLELMHRPHRRHEIVSEEPVDALPAATDDALDRLDDRRSAEIVRSFFTELSPRQRELIELVDVEGYTPAEAARMIDVEPETARVHLLRARRSLRQRMLAQHPERFAWKP